MKVTFGVLLIVSISLAYKVKIINNIGKFNEFIFHETLNSETNMRFKRDTQTDYENSICECVPYYRCNFNGTTNENGRGIIDIRTGLVEGIDNPMTARRKCDDYLSVCCLPPEIVLEHSIVQMDTDDQNSHNKKKHKDKVINKGDDRIPNFKTDGKTEERNDDINNKLQIDKGCGYRNYNGIKFRNIGNENNEANFAEFPWMVAILKQIKVQENLTKVYQCGGSLIHKRAVLTAAHCVSGKMPSQFFVRAGEWDTQTANEPLPHQDREVSIISVHPKYQKDILHNDFALLIMSKSFDIADNVQTICLPEENEYFNQSNCFSTGWGKNEFGDKGHFQVLLKAVELPIISHDRCQTVLRNTRLGKYFKLDESFMCAGGIKDIDTCTGDGGSPLVCPLPNDSTRYVQVGIVAWGIACGQFNIPGVYADVTKGRRWIDSTLMSYKINSVSYSSLINNKNYLPL